MKIAYCNMVVIIPDVDATDEQIKEFISCRIGERCSMSIDNPLCELDIETEQGTLEVDVH